MKKIKFAAQIFILIASFPVLFVSGISHHNKKTFRHEMQVKDSAATAKKVILKKDCICLSETVDYKDLLQQAMLKY